MITQTTAQEMVSSKSAASTNPFPHAANSFIPHPLWSVSCGLGLYGRRSAGSRSRSRLGSRGKNVGGRMGRCSNRNAARPDPACFQRNIPCLACGTKGPNPTRLKRASRWHVLYCALWPALDDEVPFVPIDRLRRLPSILKQVGEQTIAQQPGSHASPLRPTRIQLGAPQGGHFRFTAS